MRYLSLQRYTIQPMFPNAVHLQTKTLRFFNIRISLGYIWSYKKTGRVGRHGENSFYSSFYRYSVGVSPSSILYLNILYAIGVSPTTKNRSSYSVYTETGLRFYLPFSCKTVMNLHRMNVASFRAWH